MPVCALPNADGFIAVVPEVDAASCSGYVMVTAQEYGSLMDFTQVTGSEATQMFSLGFSLVFFGGFISTYAIKMAIRLIKLL
ncbi:single-stranded DNA-binding protein [Vibrio parahaemolyticus]|uniref:single-stranded DNA-binding protein n=1 Tax=Vibrio parahaemolyticus TaxID=670 RepID=UPI00146B86CD|nr:single-stranded DNA-binding protein [Vibrio parahaemolyticus]MBE4800683.1 single-stranded DNA-binding protein [Vibrio parahaemolyticus]MDF4975036.1 single-stranded DNA-binding protein [Vibrio parahaemolyticus]MDF4975045.1 single-stranded DNA-binding protein [Vibrio parahaemolyticus]MDF5037521.1 single-stranded DNA-binding protein [Vibrio parahaemolyticus]MDF5037530.1 single-stranded DNA-binding protein [Vibrio parahaemolyticus]